MRADIHNGPEHNLLQAKAGYIDARPHLPDRRKPLAPRGRTIHWVIFDLSSRCCLLLDVCFSNRPSRSSTFRLTATAMSTPLTGSCFSSESAQGPSIMGFEDERDKLYRGLVVSSNGRSKRTCELIS